MTVVKRPIFLLDVADCADYLFTEGEEEISSLEDYNSENTQQLGVEEIKEKLLKLDFIKEELRRAP